MGELPVPCTVFPSIPGLRAGSALPLKWDNPKCLQNCQMCFGGATSTPLRTSGRERGTHAPRPFQLEPGLPLCVQASCHARVSGWRGVSTAGRASEDPRAELTGHPLGGGSLLPPLLCLFLTIQVAIQELLPYDALFDPRRGMNGWVGQVHGTDEKTEAWRDPELGPSSFTQRQKGPAPLCQ